MKCRIVLLLIALECCFAYAGEPPIIRFSAGWPAINSDGFAGVEGRVLVGSPNSPVRFGIQLDQMREISIFPDLNGVKHVDGQLTAAHAVLGYEALRSGLGTATPFIGLGWAESVKEGRPLPRDPYDRYAYQELRTETASLEIGADLGLTRKRNFGLSLTIGGMINSASCLFAAFKLDFGNY